MSGLVFGISMMRDEADVAEHVIQHMFEEGLDGIIVADNCSKDGTRDVLEGAKQYGNLVVQLDQELGYWQSKKMTNLAHQAAGLGADWIVPFDADEIWYSREDRVAEVLRNCGGRVAAARLYNHFPSSIDPDDPVPFRRIVYRQLDSAGLPKVAFRYHPSVLIEQGNHGVFLDGVSRAQWVDLLELRHFPYRSAEQFVRKAKNGAEAYAATDLPPTAGAHWREYGAILERSGEQVLIEEVFEKWFHFPAPVTAGLVLDPAPFCRWD